MTSKILLFLFLIQPFAFAANQCELYTLSEADILKRSGDIYKDIIKTSNLRAILSKFGKKIFTLEARKKLLSRLQLLNRRGGIIPVYYTKDPELTTTQIHFYLKKFTKSEAELKEIPEAAQGILKETTESIETWLKTYENYPKNLNAFFDRVISLQNQVKELEELTSFNKRIQLNQIKNGEVVTDFKNSRFVRDRVARDLLVKTIQKEIKKITGNDLLGFQLGSILQLDHKQAVLNKQLEILFEELESIVDMPQKYNNEEFSKMHKRVREILKKKELLPTVNAKAQLRFHETFQEFSDIMIPKFLKREAKTYEEKLLRLQNFKKSNLQEDETFEVFVAGIDRFAVFYRRYGMLVIAGTALTGVTLPAFTAFSVTSYFQSDKTRRNLCVDILNPHVDGYETDPSQRQEEFEDCYFSYLKKKLGKDFVQLLEDNSTITIKTKKSEEVGFDTKVIPAVEQHKKYQDYLMIQKQFKDSLKEQSKIWKIKESVQNEQINLIDPENIRNGFPLND